MKITIVSRGDASSGGAGRVAELLAGGLKQRGNKVCHIVRNNPRIDYRNQCQSIFSLKGDVLLRNLIGIDISGLMLLVHPKIWDADIVHFHDFSVAFGPISALTIAAFKPVVFTLHDFSGLTGGCLYPSGCTRYNSGCGKCPQVGTSPLTLPVDLTKYHFRIHKKIAESKNVTAVVPSNFLHREAKKGAWKNGNVQVIPNAIETDLFVPALRNTGRRLLRLDGTHKALLFVASRILDPRKGFVDLAQAFLKLAPHHPDVILVLAGKLNEIPIYLKPYQKQIKKLGIIKESLTMAKIYAACDCHILPTREDNFPCTIIESLSVGTPVIAYRVGGIPEMFQSPEQGYIVAPNDPKGLLESIQQILNKNRLFQQQNIRRLFLSQYSTKWFIDKHIELYKKIFLRAYSS